MATDVLPAACLQLVLQPSRLSFGARSLVSSNHSLIKPQKKWDAFCRLLTTSFVDLLTCCWCPLWRWVHGVASDGHAPLPPCLSRKGWREEISQITLISALYLFYFSVSPTFCRTPLQELFRSLAMAFEALGLYSVVHRITQLAAAEWTGTGLQSALGKLLDRKEYGKVSGSLGRYCANWAACSQMRQSCGWAYCWCAVWGAAGDGGPAQRPCALAVLDRLCGGLMSLSWHSAMLLSVFLHPFMLTQDLFSQSLLSLHALCLSVCPAPGKPGQHGTVTH